MFIINRCFKNIWLESQMIHVALFSFQRTTLSFEARFRLKGFASSDSFIVPHLFQTVKNFFILFFEIFQKIKSRKPFRFPAFAPTRNFMLSCFVSYRFCDSDIYLTTSFRHCQELFSFNFIIFKRNQITFRCAISQLRQQIKYYHTSSIMSRTFLLYANHVL